MKKPVHPKALVPLWAGRYPGVTFADCTEVHAPQQVTASVRVPAGNNPIIGEGSYIGLNVQFRGSVDIGKNCVIESGCIIENSVIGNGTTIGIGSRIYHSYIGDGCIISEHSSASIFSSYIGDNCEIDGAVLLDVIHCEGCRVGPGAQQKRSTMGVGSRMDHFGYLGDTRVGEHTTIGAGVVTANFDGKNKNKTHIGDHCLVGVNVSLVSKSPELRIGDNVVIAAGSTITEDVPDDHLAFGRARQVNKLRK